MSRSILFAILFLAATDVVAQEGSVRGTITYIAGEVVYTSLGREAGMRDSSVIFVGVQPDSLAQLKVFAVSSKSSACRIIAKRRNLAVGDVIWAVHEEGGGGAKMTGVQPKDTSYTPDRGTGPPSSGRSPAGEPGTPLISLHGRVGLQYFTSRTSDNAQALTQPGVVLNLNGRIKESPISFELYGNIRSLAYGTSSPFSPTMTNRTRIYKFAVNYTDTLNRISLGRLIPQVAASTGYIDGLLVARRLGRFTFGTAVGFEPVFTQRNFSSDMKKILVFGRYEGAGGMNFSADAAYARTYARSSLDREVLSWSLNVMPVPDIFILAQSDVDVRSKSAGDLVVKPKLTSMYATVNYRLSGAVSLGAGLSAWRPVYSFASVSMLPDSLFDQRLQSTPQLTVNLWLPSGIAFFDSYSPRISEEPFGRQYQNYSSLAFNDLFGSGITLRGTANLSVSGLSSTSGFGIAVQKTILGAVDGTLRYQFYDYELEQLGEITESRSVAFECMAPLSRSLTAWGSLEKMWGLAADGLLVFLELGWRF